MKPLISTLLSLTLALAPASRSFADPGSCEDVIFGSTGPTPEDLKKASGELIPQMNTKILDIFNDTERRQIDDIVAGNRPAAETNALLESLHLKMRQWLVALPYLNVVNPHFDLQALIKRKSRDSGFPHVFSKFTIENLTVLKSQNPTFNDLLIDLLNVSPGWINQKVLRYTQMHGRLPFWYLPMKSLAGLKRKYITKTNLIYGTLAAMAIVLVVFGKDAGSDIQETIQAKSRMTLIEARKATLTALAQISWDHGQSDLVLQAVEKLLGRKISQEEHEAYMESFYSSAIPLYLIEKSKIQQDVREALDLVNEMRRAITSLQHEAIKIRSSLRDEVERYRRLQGRLEKEKANADDCPACQLTLRELKFSIDQMSHSSKLLEAYRTQALYFVVANSALLGVSMPTLENGLENSTDDLLSFFKAGGDGDGSTVFLQLGFNLEAETKALNEYGNFR